VTFSATTRDAGSTVVAGGQVPISTAVPLTYQFASYFPDQANSFSDALLDGAIMRLTGRSTTVTSRVYDAWCWVTYILKPTLTVDAPSGTITTNNRPNVEWTAAFDIDGDVGGQASFTVRIFNEAQYTAGGFDPATSIATAEIDIAGPDTQWTPPVLPNDLYRAYVRVGQDAHALDEGTD
jgi:hypothetical protein